MALYIRDDKVRELAAKLAKQLRLPLLFKGEDFARTDVPAFS
jgi:uncharacterized protein with PIN domain